MVTDLYFKEKDRHLCLHYQSSYPEHIKKVDSLTDYISQALSLKETVHLKRILISICLIRSVFLLMVIQKKMVKEQMKRVVFQKTQNRGRFY